MTGAFLLKVPLRLLGLLPLRVHYVLGRFVAWLAGDVVRYRRDVVMHNLTKAFPEKNIWELKTIRKAFYRHFGELIAEAVWFGGCRNPERLRRARLVEVENPEQVARLFEQAPGLVVMYSHCGNWELFGGIYNYFVDFPCPFTEQNVCVVYRRLSSRAWDEVLRDNRFAPLQDRKHFGGYIESKDLIRYAYTHKDEKKVYNVNTDQRPYFVSPANMDIDFFGERVQTMTGAAALAHKFGMAVAYLSMRRERQGHYVMRYEPICEDAASMSVEEITQQYYRLLEAEIRQQPENYLWTHQRFARI